MLQIATLAALPASVNYISNRRPNRCQRSKSLVVAERGENPLCVVMIQVQFRCLSRLVLIRGGAHLAWTAGVESAGMGVVGDGRSCHGLSPCVIFAPRRSPAAFLQS